MPPKYVKTIQHQIFYQYAKIIARAATKGSDESFYRKMVTSKWKQLCSGEINWSTSTREWLRERDEPNKCIYCGQEKELTVEHILPRSCGGEDTPDNVVMVCSASRVTHRKVASDYTSGKSSMLRISTTA